MVKEIYEENKDFYEGVIYTDENVKRMLPLDDIVDLCNCLNNSAIGGGSKSELEKFLRTNQSISDHDSAKIKSKYRKIIYNIKEIFTKQDLEASLYSKRTHFISLFLAVSFVIPYFYILDNPNNLKEDLLDFIEDQPEEYKESVLGAIRQKTARETRVKSINKVVLKYAVELDKNRFFGETLKQKLWRKHKSICQICNKKIRSIKDASLDHIKPWAKGGITEEDNAQLAHKRCNQKKKDKYEEYIII